MVVTSLGVSGRMPEYIKTGDWITIEETIEQIDLAEEKSIKINVNKIKRVIANPYYHAAILWFHSSLVGAGGSGSQVYTSKSPYAPVTNSGNGHLRCIRKTFPK